MGRASDGPGFLFRVICWRAKRSSRRWRPVLPGRKVNWRSIVRLCALARTLATSRQAVAAIQVARPNGGYGGDNDRYLDLRVDDAAEPVADYALVKLHHLYFAAAGGGRDQD